MNQPPIDESQSGSGNAVRIRSVYLDAMRAYAITLVVLLHSAANLFPQFSSLPAGGWWASNIYDSFSRVCVPLFVMASGALLLDPARDETVSFFLKKRLSKVLLPFLFWAPCYLALNGFLGQPQPSIAGALRQLYSGPVNYHLWFVYMILGLYLVTPILRIYVRNASRRDLLYFCALWFVFVSIIPLVDKIMGSKLGIPGFIVTDYVGYFVLGYYLHTTQPKKRRFPISALVVGLCVIFTAIVTYYISARRGTANEFFYEYPRPNIIVASIFTYLLFLDGFAGRAQIKSSLFRWLTNGLSGAAFGIYLIHALILIGLEKGWLGIRLSGNSLHPALGIPLTALVVTALSLGIVLALKKVPYLRAIVP